MLCRNRQRTVCATAAAYDMQGRALAAWGATYPVAHEYDTAGRRTSLSTTRDSSADFGALASHLVSGQSLSSFSSFGSLDTTQWLYDPATGLVTNKVYADDSAVATTHTPDGKPLRTTWARAAWREHSYTASGLLAGIGYGQAPVPGPATPAASFAYDAFQRLATASNAVAAYACANSALGVATNETIVVSGTTNVIVRSLDAFSRPVGLEVGRSSPSEPPPYAVSYGYDAEARLTAISNAAFTATYAYATDGWDAGYTVTLTSGLVLARSVVRDPYRRHLVTAITNRVDSTAVSSYRYSHDLLDRATSRIDSGAGVPPAITNAFSYNPRSEVSSATIATNVYVYAYDPIGNRLAATNNVLATLYACDPLNQYTNIVEGVAPSTPHYDPDGNLLTNGVWSYTWDAENRLVAAYSNSLCVVSNAYDHASRRVLKVTPSATRTYLYDGWNLIQETIHNQQSSITNHFVWGKDLSGTPQGAGGVGGLLAVMVDNAWYFPLADANGNITEYVDAAGTIVASYRYDAYGGLLSSSGVLSDIFRHKFSSKYFDLEAGLYYYGYRFYSPELGRWLNRDPIGERGGHNLYGFVENQTVDKVDRLGQVGLNPFWRTPSPAEWIAIRERTRKIAEKAESFISNIDAFAEVQFPGESLDRSAYTKDGRYPWGIPANNPSMDISFLERELRNEFMYSDWTEHQTLLLGLIEVRYRLKALTLLQGYDKFKVGRCNPICRWIDGATNPFTGTIGLCPHLFDERIDDLQNIIAHEGSHALPNPRAVDWMYDRIWFHTVDDAYVYGTLLQ